MEVYNNTENAYMYVFIVLFNYFFTISNLFLKFKVLAENVHIYFEEQRKMLTLIGRTPELTT